MSDFRGFQQSGQRAGTAMDLGLRAYMQKVYNYMAGGLALTGLAAVGTYSMAVGPNGLTPFGASLFSGPASLLLMLATFGLVMFLSFGINRMSAATAQLSFWAYSILNGVMLSTLGMVYAHGSIARAFFCAAAAFAATSLYGYTTKRDLTSFGSFLFMGLFGLVIASLINLFFMSSAVNFALSVIGVLVFTGLAAWDTQSIRNMYYYAGRDGEAIGRLAIMGALRLYLDFINLFLSLLRLFGDRR
ncbi:MAG: Bax inhibitor-1/YccA family protein [Alphaproteobacteria bacterium]|nr:Bax inhibitor-1/YccA family protein [Alphaproteobacteria bacterium]